MTGPLSSQQGSGALYLGDVVEVPWMTVLWPYNEDGGEPLPQAEVIQLHPFIVKVRWLDRVPRGHGQESTFRYDELRRTVALTGNGPSGG